MSIEEKLKNLGEYFAAGLYEEPERSLFYRKSLGIRRYYETASVPGYNGELLYPSGMATIGIDFMSNMIINCDLEKEDKELSDLIKNEFFHYSSSVPAEHTVAGNMWTHSMPNYERIAREGFNSYEKRAEKINDKDIREGIIHVISGIRTYKNRCVAYLESVSADAKLINALKKVPFEPAENIYEAIVCRNFIMYLDCCDNLGCVASDLTPYYKGENVVPELRNLFENLNTKEGYSMSLGTDYSPITLQCLEAAKGLRRPMIELLVNDSTPDEVWEKAIGLIKSGTGQPAIYNHDILINGLRKRFPEISPEDAEKFCGGGCTESMLQGLCNVGSLDAGINLALILENVIYKKLEKSNSYEEFYKFFMDEVETVINTVTTEIRNSQKMRAEFNPVPMRTLLIDDCIDKGVDYNNGGARYMWSIINFAGMINVIDSMLVLRDFIFLENKYTKTEVVNLLKKNDGTFLAQARSHSVRFGIDNSDANEAAYKISTEIYSMLDDKKTYFGSGFIPASIQFMTAASSGKHIGATPDGREAGAPLCDSLGAILNKDTEGPTALLKSVTSLNLHKALGIPVLNFTINPNISDDTLKSIIKSYISLGGIQMQITCTSKETLEEAYKNPELHKNLIVRVGGYSEYFYRLDDDLKRSIIDRTIY